MYTHYHHRHHYPSYHQSKWLEKAGTVPGVLMNIQTLQTDQGLKGGTACSQLSLSSVPNADCSEFKVGNFQVYSSRFSFCYSFVFRIQFSL